MPRAAAEAVVNVVVGYGMAVATQMAVFPLFGLQTTTGESLLIGAIFTVTSVVRSYTLRRLFERLRAERLRSKTAALWRAWARVGCGAGQVAGGEKAAPPQPLWPSSPTSSMMRRLT